MRLRSSIALQKQLGVQRAQIKPQLDIIKLRGPTPELVDGCCVPCLKQLEQKLAGDGGASDNSSVECVGSTVPQIEGAYWTTTTTFRTKNSAGSVVESKKRFFFQENQLVEKK